MQSKSSAPFWRLSILLTVFLSACSENRVSAPVSGRVTLNGQPQEGIYIYFKPPLAPKADPNKAGTASYARTDADGHYTLNFMDADKDRPGALVATHTVTAADERTFNNGLEPDELGKMRPIKSRVPKNWSETYVVTSKGTTEANFELGGGKKK